ncbi:MAG: DUF1326 domain-containing protein [Rhodobacteraceae bacterium]|nr:DUF1326 domain-containing protein [Paracoccaceae bacterium]
MIPWELKMKEFVNCNCAYGCPCQFNAPPTHGDCKAIASFEVSEGHFGDVDLAGVKAIGVLSWPGAIHEGNGSIEAIVDAAATDAQKDAILKIMTGQETEPMATMFSVFISTMTTVHDPVFAPIDLEINVENRTALVSVPGLIEVSGEPIRNPITGDIHQARIDIPHGFEYLIAEMGAGTGKASSAIKMELTNSYGQFAHLHLTNSGPVRKAA